MAITPRLEMRQGQSLVMTPQLQQSIKLVQLNNIELSAFIDGELEQDPLLERKDGATTESESLDTPGGGWSVELNNETLPRVMVDNHYHVELRELAADSQSRSFISNCYQNANWLVRALDQRARTILKVATELVRLQEAFFPVACRNCGR